MSTALPMPVVISTSAILNAVVRGAAFGAQQFGTEYFAVIHKDFITPLLSVYRRTEQSAENPLAPTQSAVAPEVAVWSMKLSESDISSDRTDNRFFKANPPRFFFLTEDDAMDYIGSIESAIAELVLHSAASKFLEE